MVIRELWFPTVRRARLIWRETWCCRGRVLEAAGMWGLINWRWALCLCSSVCHGLCQELVLLIRLLDITDTSHGELRNILQVTQKQATKEKETVGRRMEGDGVQQQCRETGKKDKEVELSGIQRMHGKRKCARKSWQLVNGQGKTEQKLLHWETSMPPGMRDGHDTQRENCYCSG